MRWLLVVLLALAAVAIALVCPPASGWQLLAILCVLAALYLAMRATAHVVDDGTAGVR